MNILIDYREQAMKTILDDNLVTYESANWRYSNYTNNPEKTPIIVLEEKPQDLQHSLKDGRFSEQKKRMMLLILFTKVLLLKAKYQNLSLNLKVY